MVEEVKDKAGVEITNEDVFMATEFGQFIQTVVKVARGGSGAKELEFEPIRMHVNKMDISFANQLFIDGEFCNATSGNIHSKCISWPFFGEFLSYPLEIFLASLFVGL